MQPQQTDLTKIDDVKELKALAFDQIGLLEQTQANLRAIQTRIQQVETPETTPEKIGD
jgi:hypothetical protein